MQKEIIAELISIINKPALVNSKGIAKQVTEMVECLCRQHATVEFLYAGTTMCVICFEPIESSKLAQQMYCSHNIHIKCGKELALQYSPSLDTAELKIACQYPQCNKQWRDFEIKTLFGPEFQRIQDKASEEMIRMLQQQMQFELQNEQASRTFTCKICLESKLIEKHMITFDCNHSACSDCILNHLRALVQQGKYNEQDLRCPIQPCQQSIAFPIIVALDGRLADKISNMRLNLLTSTIGKYVRCPSLVKKHKVTGKYEFVQTNNALLVNNPVQPQPQQVIPNPAINNGQYEPTVECPCIMEITPQMLIIKCLMCQFEFCIKGCSKAHKGQTCQQYADWLRENNLAEAEQKFNLLVEQEKLKMCPACKVMVQKTQGCNHITCRCKHEFCYVCAANWKPRTCKH